MNITPSELWEMDWPEISFWLEGLLEISKAEHDAAREP